MKKTLPEIYDAVKKIALKIFKVLENVWVKRVSTILILIYAVYLLYSNYKTLKDSIAALTLNVPLVVLSVGIVLLTFILNISSWKYIVASFGYEQHWMDMAYVQMTSTIGKYIPGKIWNYSSKIYLSNNFGIPLKKASVAIIAEIVFTYLTAFCLFFVFFPDSLVLNLPQYLVISIRTAGVISLALVLLVPSLIQKKGRLGQLIINQKALSYAIFLRSVIWFLSGLGFYFLSRALGMPDIGFSLANAIVPASFFVGFLVFILPDGVVIRETIIIYMLRGVVASPDATILSLVYRFFLILLEFIVIFVIFLVWKSNSKNNIGINDKRQQISEPFDESN